jgi:Ca2+-binding EF-hand superfamily protein
MALEQYYISFDANNDGYVDFREFIVGIGIMEKRKETSKKEEALEGIIKCFIHLF